MSNIVKQFNNSLFPELVFPSRDDLFYPFQSLFDDIYNKMTSQVAGDSMKSRNYPRWDIYETPGFYAVEVSMPGLTPDDTKVEILPDHGGGRMLKVSGRMNREYQHGDSTKHHVRELRRSSFERYHRLPNYVQGDPTAEMKDGLLTLKWNVENTAPKPKSIPIQGQKIIDSDQ
jgi:HSP20 family molecular chaperone IbpA